MRDHKIHAILLSIVCMTILSACEIAPKKEVYQGVSGEEVAQLVDAQLNEEAYTTVDQERYTNYRVTARSPGVIRQFILGDASEHKDITINVRQSQANPPVVEVWGEVKGVTVSSGDREDVRDATSEERREAEALMQQIDRLIREHGGS